MLLISSIFSLTVPFPLHSNLQSLLGITNKSLDTYTILICIFGYMYFQWWKRKSERNLFHSHRMSRQGRIIFWFLCSRVRITKIIGCIGYILSTFKGLVFVVFSLWRKVGNQLHKIALIYETQDFQVLTVVHPLYLTPLINAHQVRIFITKLSVIIL